MSKRKAGLISEDFPLYHSDLIPIYSDPDSNKYKHSHTFAKDRILYTNEHPEFFRLKGMKQGGYFNPYINESIKVDRSECLKKLSNDRKNVNFIDFIKSNRKYSQDPKILKYITVDSNKELKLKRMGKNKLNNILTENNETKEDKNNITLNEKNNYCNIIKKLNYFVPKIDYRIKNTLDLDENDLNKSNKRCNTIGNLKQDKIPIKLSKPFNIKNYSNFKFSDMNNDINKNSDYFKFNRKIVRQYNPIKDKMETITPPPFNNKKWSTFLENYFLIANSGKKFRRKGGLFSEFCNKNINSINVNKFKIQEELKIKREEKEKEKNK